MKKRKLRHRQVSNLPKGTDPVNEVVGHQSPRFAPRVTIGQIWKAACFYKLEHRHAHFITRPWLLSHYNGRVEKLSLSPAMPKIFTTWPFREKNAHSCYKPLEHNISLVRDRHIMYPISQDTRRTMNCVQVQRKRNHVTVSLLNTIVGRGSWEDGVQFKVLRPQSSCNFLKKLK